MKELKFRVWDKRIKQMRYFRLPELSCDAIGITDTMKSELNKDAISEIMQYIGLKDKRGNEIYDGDIVTLPAIDVNLEGKRASAYIEHDGGCSYSLIGIRPRSFEGDEYSLSDLQCSDFFVIGNIYSTPEKLAGW